MSIAHGNTVTTAMAAERVADDILIGWIFSNMNTTMKWVFIIVILGAIVVGIIFIVKAINKMEDDLPKNKEDDEKEF